MTVDATELSVESGAPVELFQFTSGSTHYRYTSAARSYEFGGNQFTAAPIRRSSVKDTGNFDNTTLRLETTIQLPVAQLFNPQPPSNVWQQHPTDPDLGFSVVWTGRLLSVGFSNNEATLECDPITASIKANAPRRPYSKNCPYVLYDQYTSKLDKQSFKVVGDGAVIGGNVISVAGAEAKPDNWFAGGYITYTNSVTGQTEYRPVESSTQSGGLLTLGYPPRNLSGDVTAYAGCARNVSACTTKFDNLPNYGGQPTIPTKNPFGGTPLF
jgi:hypothetical protein